jgi:large subunit ribosomal protein L30
MPKIRVTQVKSAISRERSQSRTLKALGLHRIGDSVEHEDAPAIMGMVNKVIHLVKVENLKGSKS